MIPRASLDDVCMMSLLKADRFRILYGGFFLKSYVLHMMSRDLCFVNMFIYIYIYIQTFTWCLYVSNGECILHEFYVSLVFYLQ